MFAYLRCKLTRNTNCQIQRRSAVSLVQARQACPLHMPCSNKAYSRLFSRSTVWRTPGINSAGIPSAWSRRTGSAVFPTFLTAVIKSDGFMGKASIVDYLQRFAKHVNAELREGVPSSRLQPIVNGYRLDTSEGVIEAEHVIVATGVTTSPSSSIGRTPTSICAAN